MVVQVETVQKTKKHRGFFLCLDMAQLDKIIREMFNLVLMGLCMIINGLLIFGEFLVLIIVVFFLISC